MLNLLLAIPESLTDYWYIYDLFLVAVILLSFVLMRLLKKRSPYKEGMAALKGCQKQLKRSINGKLVSLIRLHYAHNLLLSAIQCLTQHVEAKDNFELKSKVAALQQCADKLEALGRELKPEPAAVQEIMGTIDHLFS